MEGACGVGAYCDGAYEDRASHPVATLLEVPCCANGVLRDVLARPPNELDRES